MMSKSVWCVVGDVLNSSKTASRLGPHLAANGKEVWFCNPSTKTVETDTLKKSLANIPATIDVINLCVHPAKGKIIMAEAAKAGIKSVFIQPGAASSEILSICEEANIEVVQGCVLMQM